MEHRIIHTGQHYDDAMSGTFFRDLAIPNPDFNLGVGSGTHAAQTADMLRQIEPLLVRERPDWVLLYGDTNSTAAGALAAAKLGVRAAHIEAGLRSFNRSMPEEINRIVADHLSDLLLCPTTTALENLAREGLSARAVLTGDVMFDAVKAALDQVEEQNSPLRDWAKSPYAVATIHRAENTDNPECLRVIVAALDEIAAGICPVWFAVHPRTNAALERAGLTFRHARCVPPLPYPDMLTALTHALFVLTDSGGLQKEAYFVRTPCITLRNETEWVETLANSCNALVGNSDVGRICEAARQASSAGPWTDHYGSGEAGMAIAQRLIGSPSPLSPVVSVALAG